MRERAPQRGRQPVLALTAVSVALKWGPIAPEPLALAGPASRSGLLFPERIPVIVKASSKPHTSYADLVHLLRSRGMAIDDPVRAQRKLSQVGYYRLSGFWFTAREFRRDASGRPIRCPNTARPLRLDEFMRGTRSRVDLGVLGRRRRGFQAAATGLHVRSHGATHGFQRLSERGFHIVIVRPVVIVSFQGPAPTLLRRSVSVRVPSSQRDGSARHASGTSACRPGGWARSRTCSWRSCSGAWAS